MGRNPCFAASALKIPAKKGKQVRQSAVEVENGELITHGRSEIVSPLQSQRWRVHAMRRAWLNQRATAGSAAQYSRCAAVANVAHRAECMALFHITARSNHFQGKHVRSQSVCAAWRTPFCTVFLDAVLGAMNDNVFKNGMIIFMAFGGMTLAGMDSNLLVNAAGAVFILPFVLFSAFAGQLADKYEKTR